jgi:hypothetical protein
MNAKGGAMTASSARVQIRPSYEELPDQLPEIALQHGEALWVLANLGFQGGASKSTFYEYIKSLRKLGTPFEMGKLSKRRGLANYSYEPLMELVLVLTLRVYHVVPDSILISIVRYRQTLNRFYRRAYAERHRGIGTAITVQLPDHASVRIQGAFVDLQIDFSGGALTSFGPPLLLSPADALTRFIGQDVAARALLPINLSRLSERLVAAALSCPLIRKGPPPKRRRRARHWPEAGGPRRSV